ncbi:regulatory protein-modification [Bacteriophage sp.]|nr:regulatory protein-modification [Bacteriophage sp.]UOF80143.1 regulatory protein-modification [Bacteriophage sp.]
MAKNKKQPSQFSLWVETLLAEKEMSTKDLAEKVNAGRGVVNHWVSGTNLPTYEIVERLYDLFPARRASLQRALAVDIRARRRLGGRGLRGTASTELGGSRGSLKRSGRVEAPPGPVPPELVVGDSLQPQPADVSHEVTAPSGSLSEFCSCHTESRPLVAMDNGELAAKLIQLLLTRWSVMSRADLASLVEILEETNGQ